MAALSTAPLNSLPPPVQVDYQKGLDDHISQFAIQYGFVVGFSPCMPALALLAFALDLLMIRAVLFRAVFVQQVRACTVLKGGEEVQGCRAVRGVRK